MKHFLKTKVFLLSIFSQIYKRKSNSDHCFVQGTLQSRVKRKSKEKEDMCISCSSKKKELACRVHKELGKPRPNQTPKCKIQLKNGHFFDKHLSKEEDIQRAEKKAEHLFIRRYKPKLQGDEL